MGGVQNFWLILLVSWTFQMVLVQPLDAGDGDVKPMQTEKEQAQGGTNHLVESKKKMRMIKKVDNTLLLKHNQDLLTCNVSVTDPEIFKAVRWFVTRGAKLLEYNMNFPKYETNPLTVNMSNNFQPKKWARAFTKHGRILLTLSFNYALLSITMLSFGVESIEVDLVDEPMGCFGKFTAEQKMAKIMAVMMSDFTDKLDNIDWVDYACHQTIQNHSGIAAFEYRCHERTKDGERIFVADSMSIEWISIMFVLIGTLKIVAFLLGPMVLYSSFKEEKYLVKLDDPFEKTITMIQNDKPWKNVPGQEGTIMKFPQVKKWLDKFPAEKIQSVSFKKLCIEVDYRWVMGEKSVPVGLFRFLYAMIIFCGIRRWKPFLSCCKQSICGSWSARFLCCSLCAKSESQPVFTWKSLFRILGGLLLLLLLPIPYYVRVWIYYHFEQADVIARKNATNDLHLHYPWEHTLLHIFDPLHKCMLVIYVLYCFSFIILAVFRRFGNNNFEYVAMGAIQDLREMNRKECIHLLISHIVLPFEKFGICGGVLIGVLYWPIILPICLLVSVIYSVPTLYLFWRFFIHSKPNCLSTCPKQDTQSKEQLHACTFNNSKQILSDGTDNISTCLLLQNISPQSGIFKENCSFSNYFVQKIVGVFCIILMLSMLIFFTEVLGFMVEVFVFTLMGAIVNASSASKYLMLGFWILIYSSTCFNNVYNKYMELSQHVFKTLKTKLEDQIQEVTRLRADVQQNTAFKYFKKEELHHVRKWEQKAQEENNLHLIDRMALPNDHDKDNEMDETLEYSKGRLNWRIHNLVLFIDKDDEPYIPRSLFYKICDLNGPGCPGPIHQSIIDAFKDLGYMIFFLLFVLITVMTFGEAYKLSSTNQLLVTLAGGFIPTVVKVVIKPKAPIINLETYSFQGKLEQLIYNYSQLWPVTDLSFTVNAERQSQNANYHPQVEENRCSSLVQRAPIALQDNFNLGLVEGKQNGENSDMPLIEEKYLHIMIPATSTLSKQPLSAVSKNINSPLRTSNMPMCHLGNGRSEISEHMDSPSGQKVEIVFQKEKVKINLRQLNRQDGQRWEHFDCADQHGVITERFVYHRVQPSEFNV